MLKSRKPKVCKACSREFTPTMTTQKVCSPQCAIKHVAYRKAEEQRKQWRKEAREYRKAKQDGPMYQAQRAVNEFVKVRDADQPCIVHGEMCPNTEFDAGHFKAVGMGGGSPLRLNLWNIHRQCRSSNRGAHNRRHYKDTVPGMYRSLLVERIGEDRVQWLEGPHEPKQYREQDLKRIARIFRKRARLYEQIRSKATN